MLTIPQAHFTPWLPVGVSWIKGQLERGEETGYLHWQICLAFSSKKSLAQVTEQFGPWNSELTRSEAASNYVWKEATHVEGTRFELGARPLRVNSKIDWEEVYTRATFGDLMAVPAFVRVKSYRTLRAIASDYARPRAMERKCKVFWGPSGTGKSRRAWEEAGDGAYIKSSRTKYWDGYQGEQVTYN